MKLRQVNFDEFEKRIEYYKNKSLTELQAITPKWACANDCDKMLDSSLHPKEEEYTIFLVDTKELFQLDKQSLDSTQLVPYTGAFQGGLHFYVKGSNLYCRNEQRGNVVIKLQHVRNDLFILDENIQIEFKKDSSDQFSGIHWYRADGTEAFRIKENIK